jgi:hypothetical protein
MDAVYTHVNGADPTWRAAFKHVTGQTPSSDRFLEYGELALSITLLLQHCPWIRTVFVVHAGALSDRTARALARWVHAKRVRLVPQETLIRFTTFCSCTVEAHLHLIPGLSNVFLYSNDDMMVGRPLARSVFLARRPIVDVSAMARSASRTPCNMAEQHCDNAWALVQARGVPMPSFCRVAHVISVMVVSDCRRVWERYRAALLGMCREPLRTPDKTVNFQFLVALDSAVEGTVQLRGAAHASRQLALAFVEDEEAGLEHILLEMPHRFCVNGVTPGTRARFAAFATAYLQRVRALRGKAYPRIRRWFYGSVR